MKRKFRTLLFIGLIVCIPVIIAFAAGRYYATTGALYVPHIIPYQGHLDTNGQPANGVFSFDFQFFNSESAGTALGIKYSYPSVKVTDGSFNVDIGPVSDNKDFDSENVYLEITVGGNSLSPRQKINSVPFAINSHNSDLATTARRSDRPNYIFILKSFPFGGSATTDGSAWKYCDTFVNGSLPLFMDVPYVADENGYDLCKSNTDTSHRNCAGFRYFYLSNNESPVSYPAYDQTCNYVPQLNALWPFAPSPNARTSDPGSVNWWTAGFIVCCK